MLLQLLRRLSRTTPLEAVNVLISMTTSCHASDVCTPQGYVRPYVTNRYHIGTPFLKDYSRMLQTHTLNSKGQLQAASSLQPGLACCTMEACKAYASGAYKEQSVVNAFIDARSQNF